IARRRSAGASRAGYRPSRTPIRRHAAIGGLIGRLQWDVHVAVGTEEQRHLREGSIDRDMLEMDIHPRPRDIARQRQGLVGGQVVRLLGWAQPLNDSPVYPLGIMRAWGKQVHDQQVDAVFECRQNLVGEILNILPKVLVPRRQNLDEGDESVAADVTDSQRAAAAERGCLEGLLTPRPRRCVGHGNPTRVWWQRQRLRWRRGAGVQREYVRNG